MLDDGDDAVVVLDAGSDDPVRRIPEGMVIRGGAASVSLAGRHAYAGTHFASPIH